jgi:hypothetical protein
LNNTAFLYSKSRGWEEDFERRGRKGYAEDAEDAKGEKGEKGEKGKKGKNDREMFSRADKRNDGQKDADITFSNCKSGGIFWYYFCALCVTFASSAFKNSSTPPM